MALYQRGDRVVLVHTSDPYTRLRPGTAGTVRRIDARGTVHIKWDDGSSLGMIPGEDVIRRIAITEDC